MSSHRPAQAPPWWPDNEPWPPRGRRGPPRRVLRFLLGIALLWFGVAVLVGVVVGQAVQHGHPALWFGALLLVVLALSMGGRAFRRTGAPLEQLSRAARQIEAGDYSARVRDAGPPWVRSMARAFNSMSERLEASDRRRRGFLAELAHELRTPLSVIRAQAEAISEGVYPGDAEHVAPILESTRTLEALVADLRILAESDAGALPLQREAVVVADLLDEMQAAYAAQAAPAGVELRVQAAPGIPAADADPARLRRVLGNLVTNALAHTPPGGSVTLAAAPAGEGVEITVTDTGPGMPPELAARAFDRFARGPGSRGSGLGLPIARDIVTAHGGSITLDTEPGRGTRVTFTLPAAASSR